MGFRLAQRRIAESHRGAHNRSYLTTYRVGRRDELSQICGLSDSRQRTGVRTRNVSSMVNRPGESGDFLM